MMNIRNIYNLLIITLILAFLNGCPKPGSPGEVSPEEKKGEEQVEVKFYPLEIPADKEIIPAKYPVKGELNRSGNLISWGDSPEDVPTTTTIDNLITTIDTANSQAFKIQILTSKVYSDVRRAKLVAEEIFDRPVYLDYEVPYYKLRVGSFADRDQAEEYLQQVRMSGYSDAWIVVTNVAVKSIAPLYDDQLLPVVDDSLAGELLNKESGIKIEKTVTDE